MHENFKKLKTKYIIRAIIAAVILGAECAGIAVGVTLLSVTLADASFAALWYALIAVGAGLIAAAVAFLCLYPRNKKFAKQLDGRYSLEERTQTALSFAERRGVIYDLQRIDADKRIAALPKSSRGKAAAQAVKSFWQVIVLAVLCAALIISAVCVMAKKTADAQPADPDKIPFSVSEYQIVAVRELINDVNNSALEHSIKSDSVVILRDLAEELPNVSSVGAMQRAVYGAIDGVCDVILPVCTYRPFSVTLGMAELPYFVRVMRRGAEVYKDEDFTENSAVEKFKMEKFDLVLDKVDLSLGQFVKFLGGITVENGLKTKLTVIAGNISYALLSSEIGEDDPLFTAVKDFGTAVAGIIELVDEETPNDEEVQAEIEEKFNSFAQTFTLPLSDQAYSLAVNRHVNLKLRSIFGLEEREEDTDPDFTDGYEVNPESGDNNPSDGGGEDTEGGGYGTGGNEFGSDDLVYDPDSGMYVQYGDILARYYAIMQEYLRDGNLTEEQQAQARSYFDILFNGFKNNNANNE